MSAVGTIALPEKLSESQRAALVNLLAAGVWRFLEPGVSRWLVCSLLVVGPYVMLGRGLLQGRQIGKRIYRYADG